MKYCSRCQTHKNEDQFGVRRASKDGLCPICKPCAVKKAQEWYEKNKARKSAYDSKYRELNAERLKERSRKYAFEHRAEAVARAAKWAKDNPEKFRQHQRQQFEKNREKRLNALKEWAAKNPDRVNANTARRRARKLMATPAWANKQAIADIYKQARRSGMHVDHIVPLRSRFVCGLHVESNLQILPSCENQKKGNRHWPDMPKERRYGS